MSMDLQRSWDSFRPSRKWIRELRIAQKRIIRERAQKCLERELVLLAEIEPYYLALRGGKGPIHVLAEPATPVLNRMAEANPCSC